MKVLGFQQALFSDYVLEYKERIQGTRSIIWVAGGSQCLMCMTSSEGKTTGSGLELHMETASWGLPPGLPTSTFSSAVKRLDLAFVYGTGPCRYQACVPLHAEDLLVLPLPRAFRALPLHLGKPSGAPSVPAWPPEQAAPPCQLVTRLLSGPLHVCPFLDDIAFPSMPGGFPL